MAPLKPSLLPVAAAAPSLEADMARRMQHLFFATIKHAECAATEQDERLTWFDTPRLLRLPLETLLYRILQNLGRQVAAECFDRVNHTKESHLSTATNLLVAAHVLIERLTKKRRLVVSDDNVHALVITAVIISAKMMEDVAPRMCYFSVLSGMSLSSLIALESTMLSLLDFDCTIAPTDFNQKLAELRVFI